jgi:hypothetical protein
MTVGLMWVCWRLEELIEKFLKRRLETLLDFKPCYDNPEFPCLSLNPAMTIQSFPAWLQTLLWQSRVSLLITKPCFAKILSSSWTFKSPSVFHPKICPETTHKKALLWLPKTSTGWDKKLFELFPMQKLITQTADRFPQIPGLNSARETFFESR